MAVHLDLETYSEAGRVFDGRKWSGKGLQAVGLHHYARHPSTDVLCIAYGFPNGDVRRWVPGDPAPAELLEHIRSGGQIRAWNAAFEFEIWNRVLCHWPAIRREQIHCSQARAAVFGLPLKLADASRFFDTEQAKDAGGKTLLKRYSKPRNPSKNDPRTRRIPEGGELEALVSYCEQDVRAERHVHHKCEPVSPFERRVWLVDQRINARGVAIDLATADRLQTIVDRELASAAETLRAETNGAVTAPTQVARILAALRPNYPGNTLDADTVAGALARDDLAPRTRRILEARQRGAHASVRKLAAIRNRVCDDGRIRGLFAYYGAFRTGRWAGRGPQPQNLPRGDGRARPDDGPIETLDDVASCLRGLFVASPGHTLVQADYTAIEAVVLACLANERWRVDLFRNRGDIYSATAESITGIPTRPGERHPHRQTGKIAELASGYGGGVGAWRAFGAEGDDADLQAQIYKWRDASPRIVDFWHAQENAAKAAIRSPFMMYTAGPIRWMFHDSTLRCTLPSGRVLYYHGAALRDRPTPWGELKETICYHGQDTYTRKWGELRTYGGKLTENIVQATARDLLAYAIVNADAAGWKIVLTVHDEIVCEEPIGCRTVADLCGLMTNTPAWAKNWPVFADGWIGTRYRK